MGYAAYVGRVGALAVALGVGWAIASTPGVAWAEPGSSPSSSDSADPGAKNPGDRKPSSGAGTSGGGGTSSGVGTGSQPGTSGGSAIPVGPVPVGRARYRARRPPRMVTTGIEGPVTRAPRRGTPGSRRSRPLTPPGRRPGRRRWAVPVVRTHRVPPRVAVRPPVLGGGVARPGTADPGAVASEGGGNGTAARADVARAAR